MILGIRPNRKCAFCIFQASERSRNSPLSATRRHTARWSSSSPAPLVGGCVSSIRKVVRGLSLSPPLECKKHRSSDSRSVTRPEGQQMRFVPGASDRRRSLERRQDETTYTVFGRLLEEQLLVLRGNILRNDMAMLKAWGLHSVEDLQRAMGTFRRHLRDIVRSAEKGYISSENNPLFHQLRTSFVEGNVRYLVEELKHSFITFLITPKLNMSTAQLQAQERLADCRYPSEWYPATRAVQRTIHLHIGPTNSGKTYHALKELERAKTGIYAGPLRLLAHEVYSRFNAKGKSCALVTGEERRVPSELDCVMQACTVEMIPLNAKVDVAVIDEIQMIGDEDRGWAWTQALLGVQARNVHLCGEVRTEELIKNLCKLTGEKLIIHRYDRLNPLEVQKSSLEGKLSKLEKGDAMILFSRVRIHATKTAIENTTGKRCAVVYGSLPPETRAQQAALFNDPDNDYDFLVASDAVGMGLNLSIKRVVFESTSKNDGYGHRLMRPWEIKQIAGRAGRFKTAHAAQKADIEGVDSDKSILPGLIAAPPKEKNVGWVTTFEKFDLPILQKAMSQEVKPLQTACIMPPASAVLNFASYFPPDIPFSYIYLRLFKMAARSKLFTMARLNDQIGIADLLHHVNLSNVDRMTFMSAPVALSDPQFKAAVIEMAECVANHTVGALLELTTLDLELLERDIHDHPESSKGYLKDAERLHKAITLYLWLSYRYNGVFTSQALAFYTKSLVEKKIDECLAEAQWTDQERERYLQKRRKALSKEAEHREMGRGVAADEETNADVVTQEQPLDMEDAKDSKVLYKSASPEEATGRDDGKLNSSLMNNDPHIPSGKVQERQESIAS